MHPEIIERVRQADLTGDILVHLVTQLETVVIQSNAGEGSLNLGYICPDDNLQEGDLVPIINIALVPYKTPETPKND